MVRVYEGRLDATGLRFGIVVSRFNEFITGKLLEGSLDALRRHGAEEEGISVAWVPGAWEIPPVAARLARSGNFDAVICLGAVIRGGTAHWQYIGAQVARGLAVVAQEAAVPIAFGVITPDNLEQAIERAGTKAGNKGFDAAMSAIETANLFRALDQVPAAPSLD